MPGNINGVMWGDNISFSLTKPSGGDITTDGQLIIGSTGNNPQAGNLTGAVGSGIGVTNGAGTIALAFSSPYNEADFTFTNSIAGNTRTLSVSQTDNTNTASNAELSLESGGASGGDPFLHFLVTGGGEFSTGIDNTDSDLWKLTSGATPSAGTDLLTSTSAGALNAPVTLSVGSSTLPPNTQLANVQANVGSPSQIEAENTDNTNVESHAVLATKNGGTNGGDCFTVYEITGDQAFSTGIDNSDSDSYKITTGGSLDLGSVVYKMTSAGERTLPLQPAFGAFVGADADVTGNGADYVIGTNTAMTQIFDQNADFNTNGTFTSPVTANYQLSGSGLFGDIAGAMTSGVLKIVTSNRDYSFFNNPAGLVNAANQSGMVVSALADMDAADTATLNILILSGVGNTADIVNAEFNGFLAV